jgi:hypothetical protein
VARSHPTKTDRLFLGRNSRRLFIGRDSGSKPSRQRRKQVKLGRRRRPAKQLVAAAIVVAEILLCLTLWGPQPAAWLWVGSQVNHQTDSLMAGLLTAFFGAVLTMVGTITFAAWLDRVWRLVRSPGGFEREGILNGILVATAVIAVPCFLFWLLVIEGPGSAPGIMPWGMQTSLVH